MTTEGQTDIINPTEVGKALQLVDSPLVRYAAERLQAASVTQLARAKQDTAQLLRTGAQWVKESDPGQLAAFVRACIVVGLNPLNNEAYLIHGGLYPSIEGRRKMAARIIDHEGKPVLRGESAPRALSDAEFTLHGGRDGDILRIVDIFRSDRDVPAQGVGLVRKKEIKPGGNLPVQDRPEFMAAKRAAMAALRVAFPALDGGTAEVNADGRLVATDMTGRVIDGGVLAAPPETPALPAGDETHVGGADEVPSDGTEPELSAYDAAEARITEAIATLHDDGLAPAFVLGCTIADWLAASDEEQALDLIADLAGQLNEKSGMEPGEAISRVHAARAAAGVYYRHEAITNPKHMSEAAAQPKLPRGGTDGERSE